MSAQFGCRPDTLPEESPNLGARVPSLVVGRGSSRSELQEAGSVCGQEGESKAPVVCTRKAIRELSCSSHQGQRFIPLGVSGGRGHGRPRQVILSSAILSCPGRGWRQH